LETYRISSLETFRRINERRLQHALENHIFLSTAAQNTNPNLRFLHVPTQCAWAGQRSTMASWPARRAVGEWPVFAHSCRCVTIAACPKPAPFETSPVGYQAFDLTTSRPVLCKPPQLAPACPESGENKWPCPHSMAIRIVSENRKRSRMKRDRLAQTRQGELSLYCIRQGTPFVAAARNSRVYETQLCS
jgi:hypothetical protein